MKDDHCPYSGECPFVESQERRLMKIFTILVSVLLLSIGGLYAYSYNINEKIGQVKTISAINSREILNLKDDLKQHNLESKRLNSKDERNRLSRQE